MGPPITHNGICEPKTYGVFWSLWLATIAMMLYLGFRGDPGGYSFAGILFGVGIFWNLMRFL